MRNQHSLATRSYAGAGSGYGMGWDGLGWAGLGWAGLGWAGLGWVGLLNLARTRTKKQSVVSRGLGCSKLG